jgi:TRAP-type C4-dicarboxylate transport system substrate-binding protein
MSLKAWETLTPEQKAIINGAGQVSANLQRDLWQAREAVNMEKAEESGIAVNSVADTPTVTNSHLKAVEDGCNKAPERLHVAKCRGVSLATESVSRRLTNPVC